MKMLLAKITSFVLSLIVLFSTFSFTIEKHFCCDFLIDICYFGGVDNCYANKVVTQTSNTSTEFKKSSCCRNELQSIQGQDELQEIDANSLTASQQTFLAVFVSSYYSLFIESAVQFVPHKNYSSPKLTPDIQLLNEVFIV